MVKPAGTGSFALVISARPEPLPPSRSFMVRSPSAFAVAEEVDVLARLRQLGHFLGFRCVLLRCRFLCHSTVYSVSETISEMSAIRRMCCSRRFIRRRRAFRKAASSTITKISVKNRSTAGPNWAASTNARRKFSPDFSTLSMRGRAGRAPATARFRPVLSASARRSGADSSAGEHRRPASRAMFLTRLNATASFWKSGEAVNSGSTSSFRFASTGLSSSRESPLCTLRMSYPRCSRTY